MSNFLVLNSLKAFDLASSLTLTDVFKTGIGLVSTKDAPCDLVGTNLLDGNRFLIPKGKRFSIGAEGEVMSLVREKRGAIVSTFADLYLPETAMGFQVAWEKAQKQKVSVAPMKAAHLGLGLLCFENPDVVIPPVLWMLSKGFGSMGVFPCDGAMEKYTWFDPSKGPGSAVQTFKKGDLFFWNRVTDEVYVINKKASLQWAFKSTETPISEQDVETQVITLFPGMTSLTEAMLSSCTHSVHNTAEEAQAEAEVLVMAQRALMIK